jgi:hypothetical protein
MAIFHNVPGLKAEVLVDGEPLPEYDDDDDDDNAEPGTVTKYIEAISDKEFILEYALGMDVPTNHGVEVRTEVDEEKCRIGIPPQHLHKSHCNSGPSYFKDGEYFRQHYRFTALDLGREFPPLLNQCNHQRTSQSKKSMGL